MGRNAFRQAENVKKKKTTNTTVRIVITIIPTIRSGAEYGYTVSLGIIGMLLVLFNIYPNAQPASMSLI